DFQRAIEAAIADGQLDGTVKFYLKGQHVRGKVARTFPEAVSSKKTNAANKTDEAACEWALRSALISFQDNAKKHGANAVVDLESFYNKKTNPDSSKYECHAGTFMAGVAIRGRAAIVQ
ncbi:MAG: excinuclease ATPase subunit, partial [Azoarcus sp.]|nr:excinuclease ATPase subunit [Azoarcus sp.]